MKNKAINSLLILLSAIFLSVLAFHVRIGATADSIAVLKTTGMTCTNCSSKIAKALETLQGVAAMEVDVERGLVFVGYDTKEVKPDSLAEKVRGAGFGSSVQSVLTSEEFKRTTGRTIGDKSLLSKGCSCANKKI